VAPADEVAFGQDHAVAVALNVLLTPFGTGRPITCIFSTFKYLDITGLARLPHDQVKTLRRSGTLIESDPGLAAADADFADLAHSVRTC
jgi:hypothetical protein